MEKLKIGDFVRHNDDEGVFKILSIADLGDTIFYSDGNRSHREEKLKLWQPQVGEWCWFKDEKNTIGSLIQLVGIEKDGTYYGYSSCGMPDKAPCVEPFIGELPTFLKDNV